MYAARYAFMCVRAILKAAPMLPQSDTLGFQMAVDEPDSKSSKGKSAKQKKNKSSGKGSGDRLIELGPKKPKSAYIRRRVKLVTGKSVADALTVQVPDKDGAMGPYKKSDFKYDVKSGFLVF